MHDKSISTRGIIRANGIAVPAHGYRLADLIDDDIHPAATANENDSGNPSAEEFLRNLDKKRLEPVLAYPTVPNR